MKVRTRHSSLPRCSGETQPRILYPAKIHFKSKGKIKTLSTIQARNCLWYVHILKMLRGPLRPKEDESVQEGGSAGRIKCTRDENATSKKCNVSAYLYKRQLAT